MADKTTLTARGVADQLQVERDTVRKWVQRGILRPAGLAGRAYLFAAAEVDRLIGQRRKAGRPRKNA